MNALTDRSAAGPWRTFFLVAALYDFLLGVVFIVAWEPVFEAIGMVKPPHISYIQLTAAFIMVQGFGYFLVFLDPWRNTGIVKVGAVYKAMYSGLAGWYVLQGTLPSAFFAWFAVFDVLFLIGFLWFLRVAGQRSAELRGA